MTKNIKRGIVLILIVLIFIGICSLVNLNSLTKKVYVYNNGSIDFESKKFIRLYDDDFNYTKLSNKDYPYIGYLNKNNYFKENINISEIDNGKVIYVDPFQEYINVEDPYLYGGLYVNSSYYDEFMLNFDFTEYYKELSLVDEGKSFNLSNEECEIIKNIVLNNVYNDRNYDGIKQYLSEYSYDLNIRHKVYTDIYLKLRIYRDKNDNLILKFNDMNYYVNEFKNNDEVNQNTSYYTYRGDDYGYLYNNITTQEDLENFAFHDYIIETMDSNVYSNYASYALDVINDEKLSIKDKLSLLKQTLYIKYKPTNREDFSLKIDRIKNLNIIGDNRKTYRINHKFLFDIFNYPANVYSLAFYEDDVLYTIPERYKELYENFVNIIINDPEVDYLKKNDMIVELQNHLAVVDEKQLSSLRDKYGEIEILEESVDRIKYTSGYYGFLYDDIGNINDLKDFALHKEVLDNIFNDYFKDIYINRINEIIDDDRNLDEKLKSVVECQLKFTLIPITKQKYYRETYKNNYFNQSYINKIKKILS
ncbi:hypothetical protein [Candidatus Arthromitus sp. SFB-rat-Yit]|uniref:hypothetical protein n=1 Tax=Candidatus Arthromitus sp. SFB-rat-Yit TaxID=1041504 RepID=UPI000227A5BD|nr:hypothetical protein [Candidatus Arthromitus sp. SFB-rat-Yit]BAK80571.1 hypothetical protein RATSFB_0009 [Candidatus Arthromitus sp. SFB-rat-Yit]